MKNSNTSRHTRYMIFSDKMAKAVIWAAAGVTLTILILIVGYIMINGFYTRDNKAEAVLPEEESVFSVETETGLRTYALLVHPTLRLKSLSFDELREIAMGLNSYWGYLTGQNRNITFILPYDPDDYQAVGQYLFKDDFLFSPNIAYYNTKEELSAFLLDNNGSLAIVPADWIDDLTKAKPITLRSWTLLVHPDLLEIQNNRSLREISIMQLENLMQGKVSAWSEIGGPEKEIRPKDEDNGDPGKYEPLQPLPVYLAEDVSASFLGAYDLDRERTIIVPTTNELLTLVLNTPGAFAVVRRDLAVKEEFPVLEVSAVRHSLNLRPSFFLTQPSRAGAVGGISTIIINTLIMILFVLLIATPIGVGAAIYLVMYARQGLLLKILRLGTDTLAGIPSIIFGLFGLVFFSQFLGFKTGLLAGSLTLTIMVLPTLIRTSEEAIRSVQKELIEGSMALGATKHQTIMRVILPAASPGILTGIILAIGRAIGETAALLFTMGSNLALLKNLNSPMRSLSVHLYILIREYVSVPNAFATATILVIIVFLVNFAIRKVISKMNKTAEV